MTHWTDGVRIDGMSVAMVSRGENWFIQPPKGDTRPIITICPCCDKPLITQRAAMLVCDALYPIPDSNR
jgi:hypothetical protein